MATIENNMATMANVDKFEDEFPQLPTQRGTTNAGNKTTKRRITTTLLTSKESTVVARPVPAAIAFPPLGASDSKRPPVWAKRSLLEKRLGAPQPNSSSCSTAPTAWGPKPTVNNTPRVWGTINEVPKEKSRVKLISNQSEEATTVMEKLPETKTKPQASLSDSSVNKQAAKLYGFLIKERFVKSTCAELQVLLSLLYRADCTSCGAAQPETLNDSDNSSSDTSCKEISEFCWRTHCLDFAEIIFLEIEFVIANLGVDLLQLVRHSLHDAEGICADMLERLDQESRRREDLRVAESARIGCQLPVEMKTNAVRDFALPFNEETDSRLHYRTPAESLLYTNREKIRDGFLSLLRQFQQKQHSLVGIENAGVAAAAIAAARELLTEVSPENRWWFAKFFVQELVQVGSNPFGESDKDLVLKIMEDKHLVKNPDRLRKLHRRFSSQKPSNKSPQSHMQRTGGPSNNNRSSGKGNNNSLRKNRQDTRTATNEDDSTKNFSATLDRMRGYFTDNQLFFFHFLHSCDSYEFSELVKHQLERQFYVIQKTISPATDARKDFTEVVLKLKVVAKFLGYLRFSPQWQVTSSIRGLSAQNAAFKAVEREGIDTLEVARDSSLDVKTLLENSILHASISKCIPWLCDYLSMLSLDKLSSGTTYFKQLIVLLQLLYRSPRLNSLGETGLYIAMQIERIFHVLRLDIGFIHGSDYQSKDLLSSSEICDALVRDDVASPEESDCIGEDHLPFLYSQVFVQNCVSELDDLRGFIQTRAQPSPRRKLSVGSGSTGISQPVTPIRKLRPLQVVIEDDRNMEGISSFAEKHDNGVHAGAPEVKLPTIGFPSSFPPVQEENDKLSEAVFKVHPKLKAVVEFVVGAVTTDICEHVMTHTVSPRADALVDRCASESGLLTTGKKAVVSLPDDAAFAARASFQMLITSKTRHEANSAVAEALQEALRLGEERVSMAVPPFMPPSSHPTLTNSIVFVALQRTRGTLKTLVPKSSQTKFVKRVAFRNKSLMKDLGSKTATTPPTTSNSSGGGQNTASGIAVKNKEEQHPSPEEHRYKELRRQCAVIFKSASQNGHKNTSLAEWEAQVTALSKNLMQFSSSFNDCVAAGDMATASVSPLNISALILWDFVWRAITSCLKFFGFSLDVFAVCELFSMKDDRVDATKKEFDNFVTNFLMLIEVVECSLQTDDAVISRLESMFAFVSDIVMELPSKMCASVPEDFVKQFAVPASKQITAKLRVLAKSRKSCASSD
ncbi:hypothetical protein PHMEG_0007284 [Phytophthora megakarya]|uniref:Uncharacterized protein n=1 Tax=Phytophthora megakarya TaxID=4795 RepID=A0A225WLP1_9STRA|nr:hypothetical protein PHMEG_0007284 [Phytophthora megakarya]